MTTPIGDAAAAATGFGRRSRVRRTAPQPVLSAPVPETTAATALEDPVSPTAPAALAAIQQQAALIEADTHGNLLAVIITARHVGKAFTAAECVAVADFLAGIEAENRGQRQALAAHPVMSPDEAAPNGNGHRTGPQTVMP